MKQNKENGARVANVNEAEIKQSKANLENAQQVLNMMVDVLSFIEKNLGDRYEAGTDAATPSSLPASSLKKAWKLYLHL